MAGGVGIRGKTNKKVGCFTYRTNDLSWFFLLHIPRASYTPHDYGEWMGVCESFTFSGILFTLAGLSSK
jgi:hypothetical protein